MAESAWILFCSGALAGALPWLWPAAVRWDRAWRARRLSAGARRRMEYLLSQNREWRCDD